MKIRTKTFKELDILISSLILLFVGILGVNSTKASQPKLSNHYFMAEVVPNNKTSKEYDYIGKFNYVHVKYISLDKINTSLHNSKYINAFDHLYTTHKIGGQIVSTPTQLRNIIPNRTATMTNPQLKQVLKEVKLEHGVFLKQSGHDNSLVKLMPIPTSHKRIAQDLMYHHKSSMKKLMKIHQEEQMMAQKQQLQQMQQQQGQNQDQGQQMQVQK